MGYLNLEDYTHTNWDVNPIKENIGLLVRLQTLSGLYNTIRQMEIIERNYQTLCP